MDLKLNNKNVFISGSSKGIGFAIAERFISEGANVFLNGRNQNSLDKALKKLILKEYTGKVQGICSDLSTEVGINIVKEKLDEIKIDILINNVGQYYPKSFNQTTDDDWRDLIETNVMSGIKLSKHFLPIMQNQNWGRVIFISSESGIQVPENLIHYGFTKAGILAISRGLAEGVSGNNITVNSVLPGVTLTEGAQDFIKKLARQRNKSYEIVKEEFFKIDRPSSIIKRFIKPSEIADVVVFLCSPLASAISGSSIRVDGGNVKSIY
ncbi:UNVERIFIED_CONTAM: hypothetical protein GTU68_056659 [Idotea baltica]|nr:hypothetical protein [Idotea baltica]